MARIMFSTGRRSFLSRIILLIAGLAIIVLCGTGLALEIFGETTTATVTEVRFSEDRNRENNVYTTSAHVSYTYDVDGTQYTGSATFSVSSDDQYRKTGVKYLSNYDMKFREEWSNRKTLKINYLPMHPQTSDASELTEKSFSGTALRVGGIVLALLLIVLAVKPNKKQKKAAAYQAPQEYVPYTPPVALGDDGENESEEQTQRITAPKYCPNCGEKTEGGNFCTNCGSKLI